jgi:hypothetical protein
MENKINKIPRIRIMLIYALPFKKVRDFPVRMARITFDATSRKRKLPRSVPVLINSIMFGPFPDYLNNISDVRTLALFGAGQQLSFVQAVFRTTFTPEFVFSKHGTVVKPPELPGRNGYCGLADHMVKQDKSQFQIVEVDLVTHQSGVWII